jgi:hypothetical protein
MFRMNDLLNSQRRGQPAEGNEAFHC